jgi:hypothetical protein
MVYVFAFVLASAFVLAFATGSLDDYGSGVLPPGGVFGSAACVPIVRHGGVFRLSFESYKSALSCLRNSKV